MKVLQIINGFGLGGIERTLLRCLPYFMQSGVEVSICCFCPKGELKDEFVKNGIKVYVIKKTGDFLLDMVQLYNVLRKENPDLIHSRFGFTSGAFCLIAKFTKIPIIVSLHSESSTMLSSRKNGIWLLAKRIYLNIHKYLTKKNATVILGHSKNNLKKYCVRWEDEEIYKLIYNGIPVIQSDLSKSEAREKLSLNKMCQYILHIGSFREEKNHKFLIEIFDSITKIKKNVILILIGDGILRFDMQNEVNKRGLEHRVIFRGQQNNVGDYFRAADVFLFPSKSEGLGNVIIEAQMYNTPVVCSSIPPHQEALCPLQHQFMFELEDKDKAVENTLLILSNKVAKDVLEKSRSYVCEKFDIVKMSTLLIDLYKKKDKHLIY